VIRLQVLGSVDLVASEGFTLDAVLAQPKRTALLCYLAVAAPRQFHRRDVIKVLFWPEYDAEQARHALRQSLYFLRRAAGPGVIVSRGEELAVSHDHLECDAWDFERAIREERHEDALAIYRGDLLAGFHISDAPEFERWLDAERARLRDCATMAAWAAADTHERAGDPAGAAQYARRAAGFMPGDETGLRRHLLYLERLGDRAAALRVYEAFVKELAREYELEPSAQTRLLADRIRNTGVATPAITLPPPEAVPGSEIVQANGAEMQLPTASQDRGRTGAPEQPSELTGRRPWPSHRRPALIAALFLAVLGSWWSLLQDEGKPERVIVADFASAQGDSTVSDLVAHLLRSELAQSPMLSVAGPSAIDAARQRMRVQPDVRLSPALAREVANREEIKIVIEGRADAVGSGVALSASVIEVASGDILFGATDTAHDRRDSRSLLRAVGRLADAIRRGTGESVAAASRGDTLWSFTTASTFALARHMAAIRASFRGDYLTALENLEEAVAIDSTFAHAYLLLAGMRNKARLPLGPGLRALERAYTLRTDLTPRERYTVEGNYHLYVTGDVRQAVEAFRRHVEARKEGEGVWYQSYARSLIAAGDLLGAREILNESLVVYSTADSRALHATVLIALGEAHQAGKLLKTWVENEPRHPGLRRLSAQLLAVRGAWPEAHKEAERIRRDTGLDNDLLTMAAIDAVVGRLDEARSHLLELREQALSLGAIPAAIEISCALGELRLIAGEATPNAEVEDVLRRYPMTAIDTLSRPYLPLALFYARAGRVHQARAWLDAWERDFPQRFRGPDEVLHHRVRAALNLAEGKLEKAVRDLHNAARRAPLRVGMFDDAFMLAANHPDLARAYDRLGLPDSAINVYERYLSARSLDRTVVDAFELAPALERLAQLYEARGDQQRASATLARFAEQWRQADPVLRPRVLQAQRRAHALGRAPS
jgi:DNA-binding SARP family transcriptional activator